ncbi:hypothetical protein MK489_17005 [Myxococcota bacterium]|nr:hypothetical protein [Myxococcota bacterium]
MIFWSLAAYLLVVGAAPASMASPTDAEILDRIYRSATAFGEKYPGNYSRRKVTVREFDPDDGELKKSKVMLQDVWAYAGKKTRVEVLSCTIDGEEADREDCQPMGDGGSGPTYRMFGDEGRKHYRLELSGKVEFEGVPVYRIRVIPRERTKRHFDGELYFKTDDLRLMASIGTLADYPIGVRKLDLELTYEELDGYPVPGRNKMDMTLYLPLVLNMRVVSESIASEQRLLTE